MGVWADRVVPRAGRPVAAQPRDRRAAGARRAPACAAGCSSSASAAGSTCAYYPAGGRRAVAAVEPSDVGWGLSAPRRDAHRRPDRAARARRAAARRGRRVVRRGAARRSRCAPSPTRRARSPRRVGCCGPAACCASWSTGWRPTRGVATWQRRLEPVAAAAGRRLPPHPRRAALVARRRLRGHPPGDGLLGGPAVAGPGPTATCWPPGRGAERWPTASRAGSPGASGGAGRQAGGDLGYVFIVTLRPVRLDAAQGVLNCIRGYLVCGGTGRRSDTCARSTRRPSRSGSGSAAASEARRRARQPRCVRAHYGIDGSRSPEPGRHPPAGARHAAAPEPDTRVVGFKEIRWAGEDVASYVAWLQEVFPGARFVVEHPRPDASAAAVVGRRPGGAATLEPSRAALALRRVAQRRGARPAVRPDGSTPSRPAIDASRAPAAVRLGSGRARVVRRRRARGQMLRATSAR